MRFVCVILCLLALPAQAGPWPRGKGHWFSSTSSTWSDGAFGSGFMTSQYMEYGISDRLTMVVDVRYDQVHFSGVAYTRIPLWTSEKGHRFALEMGGGIDRGWAISRAGLSYGKGIETRWGGGWLTVDAAAITVTATRATTYKVDATVGVSPSDRWKAILQVQTSTVPGLSFDAKLAPSVVRRFGDHVWGELGLTHTLTGPQQYGLKFGVWLEF
ncbi:MAG: hypothetical protein CML60_04070 [Rhodobacteraceae bacterium]|nr:hypothetical protein [Paracoccaceae bacterium]MBT25559.1 hypothetical protein [Paracoccaceae bacterium]